MDRPWIALASSISGKHVDAFLAASKNLARIDIINPGDLGVDLERNRIRLRNHAVALPPYDGVLFRRIDQRKSFDFQMVVLREWERQVAVAINRVEPMLMALDKLAVYIKLKEAGIPVPATIVVPDLRTAEQKVRAEGLVVAKPLYGSLGEGVELWRPTEKLARVISDYLAEYGVVMLQEFVPSGGRDVRVFVIGDQAVAACTRRATEGEWRTNVAQGGTPDPIAVTPEMEKLAVGAVKAVGLDYSGVDLIEGPSGWKVLEVNGSPSFDGLSRATGVDIARLILEYLVKRIGQNRARHAA
jgi:ribosomal protein S6--L-glutamate ligase